MTTNRTRKPFAHRTALVTGGAKRLGLAIATAIAREGATVLITYQSSTRTEVKRAVAQLQAEGAAGVGAFRCDLSNVRQIVTLVSRLDKKYESIDFLVNSAANFIRHEPLDVTTEQFDETFDLNVRGPFFLSQALAEGMKREGFGRIVNIGDVAAFVPWTAYLPYSMSKAALVAMTKGLAKALAPEILVNCVAPGPVMLPDSFSPTELRQAVEPTVLGRTGSPDEVAAVVVMLLRSDYITGATIPVDGGRLLR